MFDHLDSAGNFTGTQAPGTNIHMARRTIDQSLHALDVGLPGTIGAVMGVGNLDPERDALTAEITFGHDINLLAGRNCISKDIFEYSSRKELGNQVGILGKSYFFCAQFVVE